jgi:hypoxanthine phosphoribosyltransferase
MESFQSILKASLILYSNQEIHNAIKNIAEDINNDIQSENLYVLTVMNGGMFFSSQLTPLLKHNIYHDYIHATRYGKETHIDDILDEGVTLLEIISKCKKIGAKNVFYAVLFNKLIDKKKDILPNHHSLNVPNKFVFGFGLDYKGFGRSLLDLHVIN